MVSEAGAALAAGDFDGDGFDDLVIGAPGSQVSSVISGTRALRPDAGAVLSAAGSPAGPQPLERWHQEMLEVDSTAETGDRFGASLP